jgi:agmatinase
VIQLDAHSTSGPTTIAIGRPRHVSLQGRARGLVDAARSVQVGIRTVTEDRQGVPMIDARTVHERGPAWVAQEVRRTVGDAPCYLSFDIDALDPAFAPATGTPVWGGLHSWQAAAILRDLAGLNVVGGRRGGGLAALRPRGRHGRRGRPRRHRDPVPHRLDRRSGARGAAGGR